MLPSDAAGTRLICAWVIIKNMINNKQECKKKEIQNIFQNKAN